MKPGSLAGIIAAYWGEQRNGTRASFAGHVKKLKRKISLAFDSKQLGKNSIVGIDLGDGETSVAAITNWQDRGVLKAGFFRPEVYTVPIQGRESIPTVFARRTEGGIALGESADAARPEAFEDFHVNFKQSPSAPGFRGGLLIDFANAVFDEIVQGQTLSPDDLPVFHVGCPAGWSTDDVKAYEKFLNVSQFRNVSVHRETRAAMVEILESTDVTRDDLSEAVLIIDIGSSTTDVTLVSRLETDIRIDIGWSLGAGMIDEAMAITAIDEIDDKQVRDTILRLFDTDIKSFNRLKYTCRLLKESYFRRWIRKTRKDEIQIGQYKVKLKVDKRFMDKVLARELHRPGLVGRNMTWPSLLGMFCDRIAVDTKKRKIAHDKLTILLTGGASQMPFVAGVVRESFDRVEGLEYQIFSDPSPHTTIAHGLARWGRIEKATADFRREIGEVLEARLDYILLTSLSTFPQAFGEAFSARMEEILLDCFKEWRSKVLDNKTEIKERFVERFSTWLGTEEASTAVEKGMQNWYRKGFRRALEREVRVTAEKYGVDIEEMVIDSTEISLGPIGFAGGNVDVPFHGAAAGLLASGAAAILTGLASIVLTGGVSLLVGVIGAIIAFLVGVFRSRESLSDADLRKRVKNEMPKLQANFAQAISQSDQWKEVIQPAIKQNAQRAIELTIDRAMMIISTKRDAEKDVR